MLPPKARKRVSDSVGGTVTVTPNVHVCEALFASVAVQVTVVAPG